MKNILIILWLIQLMIADVHAKTMYEVKYYFRDSDTRYTAFVVRYDNQTGFMRVRYTDPTSHQAKVVHMEFTEIVNEQVNPKTLVFAGKNPRFILGSSGDQYNADNIWFRKHEGETTYRTWAVTSPSADGKASQGTISEFKTLNASEITKDYAHLFFGTAEPFFLELFKSPEMDTDSLYRTGKLKLIVIANTTDQAIGESCEKDVIELKKKFEEIAGFIGLTFDYTEISGDYFSKSVVVEILKDLSSETRDVVIICYSGHGFRYKNDSNHPYPQFDLTTSRLQSINENTLAAGDVFAMLKKQNAHLKLLFTDCCNSEIGIARPYGQVDPFSIGKSGMWTLSNCEKLFIKASGSVIACAASPGEVAFCNERVGGFFFFNLMTFLDRALSNFNVVPTWQSIIDKTKASVIRSTENKLCDYAKCTQTSIYYSDLN